MLAFAAFFVEDLVVERDFGLADALVFFAFLELRFCVTVTLPEEWNSGLLIDYGKKPNFVSEGLRRGREQSLHRIRMMDCQD